MQFYDCHRCGTVWPASIYGSGVIPGWKHCSCRKTHCRGMAAVIVCALLVLFGCSSSTDADVTFDTTDGPMTAQELAVCGIGIDGHLDGKRAFYPLDSGPDTVFTTNLDSLLNAVKSK